MKITHGFAALVCAMAAGFVAPPAMARAPAFDVAIAKRVDAPVKDGQAASFTVNVSNTGQNQIFPGMVTVTDQLQSGLTPPGAASGSGWSCSAGGIAVTCTYNGAVAPGASFPPITVTARARGPGRFKNCAVVKLTGPVPDGNAANNQACVDGVVAMPAAAYDIGVRKSGPRTLAAGQAASFSIAPFNSGPSPVNGASGIVVEDLLPANFVGPITAGGPGWTCVVAGSGPYLVTCTYHGGPVPAGGLFQPITVTAVASSPGGWSNCAVISLKAGPDANNNNRGCTSGEIRSPVVAGPAPPPASTSPPAGAVATQQGAALVMVCANKYHDINGDGLRNGSPLEPLLNGWDFSFTKIGLTNVVPPRKTGGNGLGRTCFATTPGTITLTETLAAGWANSEPGGLSITRTVAAGSSLTELWFGNYRPARICVTKYHDRGPNPNGRRDTGEPGLAGWEFVIRDASGAIVASGFTNANGVFCTSAMTAAATLRPGAYTVQEIEPSPTAWKNTDPGGTGPFIKSITVKSGETGNLEFGNTELPARVCIVKWNDVDGDGVQDQPQSTEPRLDGWQFNAIQDNLVIATSALTVAGSGQTCMSMPAGIYDFAEVMAGHPGWTPTTPTLTNVTLVPSPANGFPNNPQMYFGNQELGEICVTKYNDTNGNGLREGAPGLSAPSFTFTVKDVDGNVLVFGPTDSQGRYCTGKVLPAGPAASPNPYFVEETPQAPWVNTDPGGYVEAGVVVTPGKTTQLEFGNWTPPGLTIEKFVEQDCGGDFVNNPCRFRIRVSNTGATDYSGPVTFTDTALFSGSIINRADTTKVVAPLPAGFTCPATQAPVTCTGPVNLPAGSSIDLILWMDLNFLAPKPGVYQTPHPATQNCASLTAPVLSGASCVDLGRLRMTKTKVGPCTNNSVCTFNIRIFNAGFNTYDGPLSFLDVVGIGAASAAGVSFASTTAGGWGCTSTNPITCSSASVSIPAGGFVDVQITLNIFSSGIVDRNCASMITPTLGGNVCTSIP